MEKVRTTLKNGSHADIPKWEYLLNWWSPIIAIVSVIVIGTGMFSNLSDRIFDTSQQKYYTIEHTKEKRLHLTSEQKEKLVSSKEFQNLKEQLSNIAQQLQEINKYLRNNN